MDEVTDPYGTSDEERRASVLRELAYSSEMVVLAARIPRRLSEGLADLADLDGGNRRASTEALVEQALEAFLWSKERRAHPA